MVRRTKNYNGIFALFLLCILLITACSQTPSTAMQPTTAPEAEAETAASTDTTTDVATEESAPQDTAAQEAPLATDASTIEAALAEAVATAQVAAADNVISAAGGIGGAPADGALPTAERTGPAISINPTSGTADTQVAVTATGFPANTQLDLYLAGLVAARAAADGPRSYVTATTDGNGNAILNFVLPTTWPSGDPLLTGQLVILVATPDFTTRANATFYYTAPTVPTATPTVPPTPIPTNTNTATPIPLPSPTPTFTPTPAQNPFVDVSPLMGAGNTRVTLKGGGFPAATEVNVFLGTFDAQIGGGDGSNNVRYAAVTTDNNGYFTVAFTMPSTWPDGSAVSPGLLLILAEANNFAQQASAVFDYLAPTPTPTINPYARVEPPAGSAGTEITISGGGFPANTNVGLYIAGVVSASRAPAARPNTYAVATTDAAGDYRMSFTMPSTWPDGRPIESGRLALLISTEDFRVRASATFDYVQPTPTPVPPTATSTPAPPPTATPINPAHWRGQYFDNPELSGQPVLVRGDHELRFNWGAAAPHPSVPNDKFSVRWDRSATFEEGVYRFTVEADDGMRLYVDNTLILESWRVGSPRTLELDYPMTAGNHAIRLEYFEDRGNALVNLRWTRQDFGWLGSYYNNRDMGGDPVLQRYDAEINFEWGDGSPANEVNADNFSARWLRRLTLDGGVYRFSAEADEGVRVWINEELILDGWQGNTLDVLFTSEVHLGGGEYTIRVDYQDNLGNAMIKMDWVAVPVNNPAPTPTPDQTVGRILFDSDPRNNRRGVNATFCSGFESECEFGNCPTDYRLVWGPFCREIDYPYIKPGLYEVTFQGSGRVRAGATDYGATNELFGYAETILDLPGSFTFCWPGRGENGYGFETVAQSTGDPAAISRIRVAYLGESCP